jgi:hypothetical protein
MNSHKTWTKVRSKKRTRVFLKNQEQHFWKTIRSGALAPAPAARAKDSVIPQIPAEVGRYCDILWYIHYIFNVYIIYIYSKYTYIKWYYMMFSILSYMNIILILWNSSKYSRWYLYPHINKTMQIGLHLVRPSTKGREDRWRINAVLTRTICTRCKLHISSRAKPGSNQSKQ